MIVQCVYICIYYFDYYIIIKFYICFLVWGDMINENIYINLNVYLLLIVENFGIILNDNNDILVQ